ncbi:phosphatidylinositol 4-kinase [Stylonychia lemnae]|uniref:Phosphatidylinositol 4-kinase n=1 Tax=Stylonychia lemnae TaxID=5949 RepID=A0A078ASM4_STYLE|nr:phosphatidylinositol 4-kinase [Stylonychia lemnae]|eukprot:CDW85480.1 phosphatidylinositol 4-kinase [Stylonychia lemnae]
MNLLIKLLYNYYKIRILSIQICQHSYPIYETKDKTIVQSKEISLYLFHVLLHLNHWSQMWIPQNIISYENVTNVYSYRGDRILSYYYDGWDNVQIRSQSLSSSSPKSYNLTFFDSRIQIAKAISSYDEEYIEGTNDFTPPILYSKFMVTSQRLPISIRPGANKLDLIQNYSFIQMCSSQIVTSDRLIAIQCDINGEIHIYAKSGFSLILRLRIPTQWAFTEFQISNFTQNTNFFMIHRSYQNFLFFQLTNYTFTTSSIQKVVNGTIQTIKLMILIYSNKRQEIHSSIVIRRFASMINIKTLEKNVGHVQLTLILLQQILLSATRVPTLISQTQTKIQFKNQDFYVYLLRIISPNQRNSDQLSLSSNQVKVNRINELSPENVYQADIKPEGSTEKDCCVICFDDFKSFDRIRTTQCSHIFHSKCMTQWVESQLNTFMQYPSHQNEPFCPTCKHDLTKEIEKKATAREEQNNRVSNIQVNQENANYGPDEDQSRSPFVMGPQPNSMNNVHTMVMSIEDMPLDQDNM